MSAHLSPDAAWAARSLRSFAALLLLMVVAASPVPAPMATFTVTNAGGFPDMDLNDGVCLVCVQRDQDGNCIQTGGCTLPAAIDQANRTGGLDFIGFAVAEVVGVRTSDITAPVTIDGRVGTSSNRVRIVGGGSAGLSGFSLQGHSGSTIRNVEITGFTYGILLGGGNDHTVQGSYLHHNAYGISAAGTSARLQVGGPTDTPGTGLGNVLSANQTAGVSFGGPNNVAEGNLIGTDLAGTVSLGPQGAGISVGATSATGTRIGGLAANQRNVISGNSSGISAGITFSIGGGGGAGSGLLVQGNRIGTDATGTRAIPNAYGVSLYGKQHVIGGTEPGAANLISGNDLGFFLSSDSCRVQGNRVGTDAAGTAVLPNRVGMRLSSDADHNRIVGNLISGNLQEGVVFESITFLDGSVRAPSDNEIDDNLIGTNVVGLARLPNGRTGVRILGGQRNRIGTTRGNVLSGNGGNGIHIRGTRARDNRVENNVIGTDRSGIVALGNDSAGVVIEEASFNTVGAESAGNVISDNRMDGLVIRGVFAQNNAAYANAIGTNRGATQRLGNRRSGVVIRSASFSIIGAPGRGNRIVNSGDYGVLVTDSTALDNTVQANTIGAGPPGLAFQNAKGGVLVNGRAVGVRIGGTTTGEGNDVIGGVQVQGGARRVAMLGNAVEIPEAWMVGVGNLRVPLDLGAEGPSCNPWAGGPGPNDEAAPPRLLRLSTTAVEGMARPGATVEVLRVLAAPVGYARHFARAVVPIGTAVANARGRFTIPVSGKLNDGDRVTLTATDAAGNTSELSQLKRPLVVLPGIGGTFLTGENGDEIWPPLVIAGTDATRNTRLARMALSEDGSLRENVVSDGVLEEYGFIDLPYFDFLDYFETTGGYDGDRAAWLTERGTPEGPRAIERDLWRFANDWRLDQSLLADRLKERIDWLTSGTNDRVARACEVDLVAHSNGGVIASVYLRAYPAHGRDHVHRFVSNAAPYLGAPKALSVHMQGYLFGVDESLFAFDPDWPRLIQMSRNLAGAYGLAPGRMFFEASNQTEVAYPSLRRYVIPNLDGRPLLGFDSTFQFFTAPKAYPTRGLGRNGPLWQRTHARVQDLISDWRTWEGPPHIYRLVGRVESPERVAGGFTSTPVAYYFPSPEIRRNLIQDGLRYEPGDGPRHGVWRTSLLPVLGTGDETVPLSSATLGRLNGNLDVSGVLRPDGSPNPWIEEFELYPCSHTGMVTVGCRDAQGRNPLARTAEILESGHVVRPPRSSTVRAEEALEAVARQDVWYIVANGRIGVWVEDAQGRRTGPAHRDTLGKIVYAVPGLGYYANDLAAALALPPGQTYTVTVQAAATATQVQAIRLITEDETNRRNVLFPNRTLAVAGRIEGTVQSGTTAEAFALRVDADGNGSFEGTLTPAAALTSTRQSPALPAPQPLALNPVAFKTDAADRQTTLVLPDVGAGWTYAVATPPSWIRLSAAAGPAPASVSVTFGSTALPVGLYMDTLRVTMRYEAFSATYGVPVRLEVLAAPGLARIDVAPSNVVLKPGQAQVFTAAGLDHAGQPFSFTPVWRAEGGTVDAAGRYVAGSAHGTFVVTASDASGRVLGQALVEVSTPVGVDEEAAQPPADFALHASAPNPFRSITTIRYDLPEPASVQLVVYDVLGRRVAKLVAADQPAGRYAVQWDGRGEGGGALAGGVYFCRLDAGRHVSTRTMVMLR